MRIMDIRYAERAGAVHFRQRYEEIFHFSAVRVAVDLKNTYLDNNIVYWPNTGTASFYCMCVPDQFFYFTRLIRIRASSMDNTQNIFLHKVIEQPITR